MTRPSQGAAIRMLPRRLVLLPAAVALAVALAACQSPAPPATPETEASETEAPAPITDAPETAALPPAPPEPVIDDDPRRLLGLDRGALGALLGEPELVRREAPVEIWQYRTESCVFDVFLYEEVGARRVSYVEARDEAARQIDARACLNRLLRARMDLPLG